jgi:hypothetical protein
MVCFLLAFMGAGLSVIKAIAKNMENVQLKNAMRNTQFFIF